MVFFIKGTDFARSIGVRYKFRHQLIPETMKNSVRYTVATILLAGAGAGVWWIWNVSRRAQSNSGAATDEGTATVTIPRYVPPAFEGKPRTELPAHRPATELPEIPVQPSDGDIAQSRAFGRRLVPLDGKGDTAAGNAALGGFLRKVRVMEGDKKLAEMEAWLASHPDSPWAASLRAEVGDARYRRGWFAKAREVYHGLWDEFHDRQDPAARGLADEALGFLLDNDLGTGRAERLKELLAQSAGRPRAGSLESKLQRAKQAVYLLEHMGAQSVMCGPLALNAIQHHKGERVTPVSLNTVPASYIATGIPLSEVAKYAVDHYRLPLSAARRTDAAAAIPVPAVLHAQDEHYVALTAAEGGKYFLVDRARHFASWVEAAAVDAMSSGNFLVPSGESPPAGFSLLAENDARNVFGRDGAHGQQPGDEGSGRGRNKGPCPGMPAYAFNLQMAGLIVEDRPLQYPAPFGPDVTFDLIYQDMDSSQPVAPPSYTHTGEIWMSGWVGYVEHVSGTLTASSELRVHDRRGGVEVVAYDVESGVFGPHDYSYSVVQRTGTSTYTRTFPDGLKEIYNAADVPAAPTKVFLSRIEDPAGNALTLTWNGSLKLTAITDPLGQVTTLQYAHPADAWKITSVTDPFSRTALLGYNGAGRLNSLTDQIGLVSTFTYQGDGFMTSVTTPYGTTQFRKISETAGLERTIEAQDPNGDIERIQFDDPGPSIESLPPAKTITVGGETHRFYAEVGRLQYRNTYYWSKEAWHHSPDDHNAAVNYRWFTDENWLVGPVLEAIKPPLEERVWFSYPGQESTGAALPYYPRMGAQPSMALRMLDATTAQLVQSHKNRLGKVVKEVDPLGRTTEYEYAANGADVVEIRQTTGGISQRLAAMTHNAQRRLLASTDAAAQTVNRTYNARGQILTLTDPGGSTATYGYNANGCLTSVDGPLPGAGDTWTITYDSLCRMSTVTNPDSYTIILAYDNMDRVTRTTHPDATYEEWIYNRLDPASYRDRAGRTTTALYNALRQITLVTDPLGRATSLSWCRCGDLRTLTDPLGRTTRWIYDIQGRVTAKEYADGSRETFTWDAAAGWLSAHTDEKGQSIVIDHYLDGRRKSVAYPGALVATPSVGYTYDAAFGRLATLADGQGTTAFSYHPITGAASPGAGRPASEDGPWANDTITYAYDARGRAVSKSLNGVAESIVYDAANRITSATNALGTFNATYDGVTRRLASVTAPGGGQSLYTYYPNSGNRRLQTLRHQAPGSALLSEFGHTWDVTGRLTGWTQQRGAAAAASWVLTNDAAGQLTGVTVTQTGFPGKTYAYEYDPAGNRTAEVIDGARTTATYNALNQLTHSSSPLTNTSYEWDGEDRVSAAVRGTRRSEFSYDGRGRRVRITEKDGAATLSDNRYLWCGYALCEERNADGGMALRRFFGQGEQTVSGGAVSLYTRDHLSSVREFTNTAGAVSQRFSYDPWGRLTGTPAAPAPAFGFTGMWHHGATGLNLAVFRGYDPVAGRWLSRDPLKELIGHNLYLYVRNAPARYTDRLGLYVGADDAAAAAAGAAVGVGGQLMTDMFMGEISGWEDYAGSALGGAVGGVATLYTGPLGGGMLGGGATSMTKQLLKIATGKQCDFSTGTYIYDVLTGGLAGSLGVLSVPGGSAYTKFEESLFEGIFNAGTPVDVATDVAGNYGPWGPTMPR